MLEKYGAAQGDHAWKKYGSHALGYITAAGEAALGKLDLPGAESMSLGRLGTRMPHIAAVGGVVVKGLDDVSSALYESYTESVVTALILEADRQQRGRVIDETTGKINFDALERDGELGWLTDPNFYTAIDREHREAIEFARAQLTIDALLAIGKNLDLTNASVASNGKILTQTFRAVQATNSLGAAIDKKVTENQHALDDLLETSRRQTDRLAKIATSNLPPRQKLALITEGLIRVDEAEQRYLQLAVAADDIRREANQAKTVFQGVAEGLSLLGAKPDVIESATAMSQFSDIGGTLIVAYITQDYLTMGLSTISLAGVVAGLGKQPEPSGEMKLLMQVLRKLAAIEKKIDEYHQVEMQALATIHSQIIDFRASTDAEFARLELHLVDLDKAVFQVYSGDLSHCQAGYRAYKQKFDSYRMYSYDDFARWLTPSRANRWYRTCRDGGLQKVLSPYANDVSVLFTPTMHAAVEARSAAEETANRYAVLQRIVIPTIGYALKYGLWEDTARSRMRRPIDAFASLEGLTQPLAGEVIGSPPKEAWLVADPGGHRFLSATEVLKLSEIARTILEWTPMIREPGDKVASREYLESCGEHCDLLPSEDAIGLLENQVQLLSWLLEQEHMIAGLPLLEFSGKVLGEEIVPLYAQAKNSADKAVELRKLLSRAPLPTPGGSQQPMSGRFACGMKETSVVRDTLCLMQANPFFAQNLLAYVVRSRLIENDRLGSYELLYEWIDDGPRTLLVDDFQLTDSASGVPADLELSFTPKWSVMLPRVVVDAADVPTRVQDTVPPKSCWHDRAVSSSGEGLYPEMSWWMDDMRVADADLVKDPRWARCYLLPAPEEVTQPRFAARVPLEAISAELEAVGSLIRLLEAQVEESTEQGVQ